MAQKFSVKSCDHVWKAGNQGVYFLPPIPGLMGEVGLISLYDWSHVNHENEHELRMNFNTILNFIDFK